MKTNVKVLGTILTAVLGISFAINAMAASTLKLPVMAENSDEISTDSQQAIKLEEKDKAAGTTTASASAVGAAPKKYTVGYLSENAVVAGQSNYNTFGSQNNLNVAYNIDKDRSLQVRQYFLYNMTNQDHPYEWTMGDVALQYTDSGKKIAGNDSLFFARLYIPTSYYAAQVGKYELRLYEAMTQAAGKYVNITYFINPRVYTYTTNAEGQTAAQVLPGITFASSSEKAFAAPYLTMYTEDMWGNAGKGVGLYYAGWAGAYHWNKVNQDYFFADIGTNLNISKTVSANIYYELGYDLHDSKYQPVDSGLSSWNLIFSASL